MATANFKQNPAPFPIWAIDDEVFTDGDTDEFDTDLYDEWSDEVRDALEDLNGRATFWRVTLEPGYYVGAQLFIELVSDDPREVDNEDCRYEWDMPKWKAETQFEKETGWLEYKLEKLAEEMAFEPHRCVARFSNGEAVYERVA